jgi:hypothetical protein
MRYLCNPDITINSRVTRLGDELSPIGQVFTLGSFSKNIDIAKNGGAAFSTVTVMY